MAFTASRSSFEEIYLDMTINELACKVTENEKFEDPLLIADLDEVVARLVLWRELLPRVQTFFAMKSCDNDVIRRVMAVLGSGFDCASKQEIQKLLDIGVKPSRIIFAHPVKFRTHIKFAASVGIHLMTFDCVEELLKIQECDPNARLVLRIRPPLESTLYNLGEKFGCYPKEACRLVQKALDLNMVVEGISFHVGFSFQDSICFVEAIKTARWLFDEVSKIGVKMSLLDIGGGYPSSRSSLNCFRQIAASIRETLDECFPPSSGVRVIAEPGQYMVAAAFNLYCKVILVKHQQDSEAGNLSSTNNTYITDGKYGCFGGNFYPHQDVQVLPLVPVEERRWSGK